MTNVSDELIEQAQRAFSSAETRVGVRPWCPQKSMRAALSAVLPVIERQWQEKVERLEATIAAVEASDREHPFAADEIAELDRCLKDRNRRLVERDQEIKALKGELKEQRDWQDTCTVAWGRLLAKRPEFSDAEREALLEAIDYTRVSMPGDLHAALESARKKLESRK